MKISAPALIGCAILGMAICCLTSACRKHEQKPPGPATAKFTESGEPSNPDLKPGQIVPEHISDFTPPQITKRASPAYPESIRNVPMIGSPFVYELEIDQQGIVTQLKVVHSPAKGFPYDVIDRCNREAIAQWKFKPAKKKGIPVDSSIWITCHIEVK